ncbi:MAG: hypothetical protein DCF27_05680 [Lysobacteraceae bacterium]|nr:MAG: hypothetical protein DCF27_05680 [Xanthomonadaceae bacterium]
MSLFAELKRRNVIRMAGLYLVGAWLFVQVAETLLPIFDTPGWVLKALVMLLALGFVPAMVVAWLFELTPEGLRRDPGPALAAGLAPQTGRRMDSLLAFGLLAVVALVAADRFWPSETVQDSSAAEVAVAGTMPAATPAAAGESIAVLAFADLSPQRDQEYFSDGMSEEILNALAKVPGLKVAGRTSSFHYKGRDENLRSIGEALGVAHILEGSVRKQGDKVRITAQLIQASDGFHKWSETYDGEMSDVFELQERIARSITDELKIVLQGGQVKRLVNAGTDNAEAYALYLQATATFNRRDGAKFQEALAQLDQAIALDPGYARAWSRKATLESVNSDYSPGKALESLQAVERAARRASELDPTLAEPHAALALSLTGQRQYRKGREGMDRALALDPDDVTVNFWRGAALINSGYREQGKQALDRALEIDPLLPNGLLWRGRIHFAQGEVDLAQQKLQRATEVGHTFVGLGSYLIALRAGDRQEATRRLAQALEAYFSQGFPSGTGTLFAQAIVGDASARAEALRRIDDYLANDPVPVAGVVPYVLFRTGEIQRGFDVLQDRPTTNDSVAVSDLFSGLLPDVWKAPGFPEFIRRMGLADYWDEFGPPDNCKKAGNGDYTCE